MLVQHIDNYGTKILWQTALLLPSDHEIVNPDMEGRTAVLPDLSLDAVNTFFFATLNIGNGFNHFIEDRRFVNLLQLRKLRNAIDDSFQHVAGSTDSYMEVLRPACKYGCIVNDDVLSIKTAQGNVDQMRRPTYCSKRPVVVIIVSEISAELGPQRSMFSPVVLHFIAYAL